MVDSHLQLVVTPLYCITVTSKAFNSDTIVCKEQSILVYCFLVFIRITFMFFFMILNFAGFMLQRLLSVCFSCTERESSTGGWVRERAPHGPQIHLLFSGKQDTHELYTFKTFYHTQEEKIWDETERAQGKGKVSRSKETEWMMEKDSKLTCIFFNLAHLVCI